MRNMRTAAILVLVGLAALTSTIHPWESGARLLEARANEMFGVSNSTGLDWQFYTEESETSAHKQVAKSGVSGVKKLIVKIPAGSISVETVESGDVSVTAKMASCSSTASESEDRLNRMDVKFTNEADVLRVEGTGPSAQGYTDRDTFHITARVPKNIDVELDSSAGPVSVGGISGTVNIRLGLGQIAVDHTGGDLVLETGAGKITVRDAKIGHKMHIDTGMGQVDFQGQLGKDNEINTGAGEVRLSLPNDTCVTMNASAGRGSLMSDLAVTGLVRKGPGFTAHGQLGTGTPEGSLTIDVGAGSVRIVQDQH